MNPTIIKDVKCFVTNPSRHNLVVVKVETQCGLHGYGCATFQQRPLAVQKMVEYYLKPILIGQDANNIENLWQMMMVNSYWRNGPVINNAIAGIDMALWDIKGKIAKMPLHQLFGGKVRNAVSTYMHADGLTIEEVVEDVRRLKEKGYRYIRAQLGLYGGKNHVMITPENKFNGEYFDRKQYMNSVVALFKRLREEFGDSIELIHDVHERLTPTQAIKLAKQLEPYDLFFLEDVVSPDQTEWIDQIRNKTITPIAIGELFNNPNEYRDLIVNRKIDYLRIHVSQIGGITPALKVAALCEQFGVNIVWHCPSDLSPIGLAVNTHLSVHCKAIAIQEFEEPSDIISTVFPNSMKVIAGFIYAPEVAGIGVEFNEEEAKKYPNVYRVHEWTQSRIEDGTIVNP